QDAKVAEKFLRHRMKEVGADQLGIRAFVTPQASRLTIHDLLEALKADYELRGKASMQNLSNLRRADSDFGDRRATELTAEQVDRYIDERLREGSAKASINRVTHLIGQAYELAVKRGHLSRKPSIRHLSEKGNERQGFLDEPEFRALCSESPDDG